MTINVTVLPESGGAVPAVRTAQPAISAAGVNDAAALARQQLPSAVPATSLIPAYAANAVPIPKPPQRITSNQPSSALAAQLIGQASAISEADLAIFTPTTTTPTARDDAANGNDFLNDLRIARGDLSSVRPAEAKNTTTPATAIQQPPTVENSAATNAASRALATTNETTMRGTLAQFAAGLPSALSEFIRRPTIIQARGVSAYQLTQARNAGLRNPAIANPS